VATWHPDAKRVSYPDAGAFIDVPARLVWHTTEGSSLPEYSGDAPHFTLNPKTGDLWQHVATDRASSALVHSGGVETNHAHAIQVELIGFAAESPNWSDAEYAEIAKLARWIEDNAGVKRRCGVKFTSTPQRQALRMSPATWLGYDGHCGHEHVPNQAPTNHWDPGSMLIAKVLAVAPKPIAFTKDEIHTITLITIERQRKSTPARRALIVKCKAKLLFYRARLRVAAAATGWNKADRRRRYAALLAVYKNQPLP